MINTCRYLSCKHEAATDVARHQQDNGAILNWCDEHFITGVDNFDTMTVDPIFNLRVGSRRTGNQTDAIVSCIAPLLGQAGVFFLLRRCLAMALSQDNILQKVEEVHNDNDVGLQGVIIDPPLSLH